MNAETRDNTIAEIHRIRRDIAARFRGDVFAINADAQTRSEASGRQIIRRWRQSDQPMPTSGEASVAETPSPSTAAG